MGPVSYTHLVARLRSEYDALYAADPLKDVTQYPGMLEALQTLRASGIRLAVCSNKPDRDTRSVVEALFPAGLFDVYYGQREGIPCKPAPDAPLLIARELGVEPAQCLYIGAVSYTHLDVYKRQKNSFPASGPSVRSRTAASGVMPRKPYLSW